MTKPNLFIVGAPKCGTTAWVEYLSSHPDIFFSPMKEPHHFNTDFPRYSWVKDREQYLKLFDGSGSSQVIGEASVHYLYSQAAAQNIAEFNPDARILIFLRPQEDFLPSLQNHLVFNGDELMRDFEAAWQMAGNRDATSIGSFCREPKLLDYKQAGQFSPQVERYFAHFPSEQIRVFAFNDWTANPRAAYLEILSFLGVKDDGREQFPRVNEASRRYLNWITPVLRRPPVWSVKAAEFIKRATGLNRLGILQRLLRLNSRSGYISPVSSNLKDEIRTWFEADNKLLEKRICRPHEWRSGSSA